MAKLETYSCDQCGTQKTKTNGWYRAAVAVKQIFIVIPWDHPVTTTFSVTGAVAEEKHYCSESCVAKAFSKAMGSGQLASNS